MLILVYLKEKKKTDDYQLKEKWKPLFLFYKNFNSLTSLAWFYNRWIKQKSKILWR